MLRNFFCAAALLVAGSALAQPVADLSPRSELRAFTSLTLSDSQFLQGDKNAPSVMLSGLLRFPAGAVAGAKLPAVIIVHGSGGNNSGHENWARALNRMGIATFNIDSFSGRGLVQVSNNQDALGRLNMVLDTFRAQEVLATHPRIDVQRIAVLGTSRGGTAVAYSAVTRFQRLWSPNFKTVATFPLYASCFDHLDQDEVIAGRIHEFHGEADNYVDSSKCVDWFKRIKAAGGDVAYDSFPGVHHSYDNVLSSQTPGPSKGAQSMFKCAVKEEKGVLINQETKQVFSYKDACVTLDPFTGHNADATAKTIAVVTAELKNLFKLP
jgi:dienelactone hydrolase